MDQSLNSVVARLQHLAAAEGADSVPDHELLRRYTAHRDSAAIELLIWRYGSMALATCRRILGSGPDVEDAFQATFLILVRKAHTVRKQSLAAWLHRVAYRAALRMRSRRVMQSKSEKVAARSAVTWPADATNDLGPVLDAEIARLPERFRSAFLMCQFEGKTNEEAARLLGVPKGTLLSRLARARQRLQRRLIQRGIAPAVGVAAIEAAPEPASAALINATLQTIHANPAAISSPIVTAAQGVIRDMNWIKFKLGACVFAALMLLGAGGIFLGQPGVQAEPDPSVKPADNPQKPNTDLDRMQGSWLITSLVARGKEQEESGVARMVIKGDVAGFIKRPGKEPDEFKLKLDASTNPASIDMLEHRVPSPGIYEFDGDKLKICYYERGPARPKSFDVSKEGKDAVLMVLKREKPEQKPAKDPDKPKTPQANAGPAPLDLLLPKKKLPAIPKDEYEMVGTWSVEAIVADGEQRDPGDMLIQFGPFHTMRVQDPSRSNVAKPLSFKLNPDSGVIELSAGGKTQIGIYRLANNGELSGTNVNHLSICVNEKGDKPPKEFTTAKGTGNVLFQLRRRSYTADTKWGDKLFPGGLVIDFGKVTGNEPKTVKVKIKNPYALPVWVNGPEWNSRGFTGDSVDTRKWLAQKWPNRTGPLEPGEEITVEFTLYPGFLPSNGGNPFDRRGSGGPQLDTIPFVAALKNYRPKSDPVPSSNSGSSRRTPVTGQPLSNVYLKLKAELGIDMPKK